MTRRRCACCGDTCQNNVRLLWKRESDGVIFYVCLACAENDKINDKSVSKTTNRTHTTFVPLVT